MNTSSLSSPNSHLPSSDTVPLNVDLYPPSFSMSSITVPPIEDVTSTPSYVNFSKVQSPLKRAFLERREIFGPSSYLPQEERMVVKIARANIDLIRVFINN